MVKRGGQHPDWDDEVRFSILDEDDTPAASTGDQPPPVPSKSSTVDWNRDRKMCLTCYADDPRDPELIGEVRVNLKEVFTKGETDGKWYSRPSSPLFTPLGQSGILSHSRENTAGKFTSK